MLRSRSSAHSQRPSRKVHYPGLKSHPDYDVAQKYMTGFGGVVSFEVKGDLWATAKFIDSVNIPYIAPSLGGRAAHHFPDCVLVVCRCTRTHSPHPPALHAHSCLTVRL